jgi:formylglycine-generating enzyme required for sulfatase activity
MVFLLLTVFVILPTQTHAGIILGFEPVWEDGATLGAPVSAGSFRDAVTGMEFVAVKGGCFQMGDTIGDGQSVEKPVHEVCVSDFSIGKYEVTQGQWQKIMGSNPSSFYSCGDDCPVEKVSWDDVQEFIRKLNDRRGGTANRLYRLPTEAEWEYAARCGGKMEKYSGGNDSGAVAWYSSNSDKKTHPVGRKQANGLGLYDMSGNVWEWVNDWYDSGYYGKSPRDNPQGPTTGSYRVNRGGSWNTFPVYVRASSRNYGLVPGYRINNLGFRLVAPVQ